MKKQISLFSLLFLSFFYTLPALAAAPAGGYTPGATLNPACAPGETDCDVNLTSLSTDTDNQSLTLSGSTLSISNGTGVTLPSLVEYGDIKQGLQSSDHNGWIKLDGRYLTGLTDTQQSRAETLGFSGSLVDATDAFLVQGSGATLGSVQGTALKTINQSHLPDVTLGGTTSTNGAHRHSYAQRQQTSSSYQISGSQRFAGGTSNRNSGSAGNHSHTITTSSINGGVTQELFDVTPRTLSVNTFIYLGE